MLHWRKEKLSQVSKTTWNNLVTHLHAVFKFGIGNGYLTLNQNPFKSLKVKVGKLPKKTISKHSFRKMEQILREELFLPDILQPRWFPIALISTLKYTAIRRKQLLNLKISDVDLERKRLILQAEYNKNHDYHIIPIADKLLPELAFVIAEHRKRNSSTDSQLFNINLFSRTTRRKGLVMSDDQLSHLFRVISVLVKEPISPHRFRHTTATELMRHKSENLYKVQQLLGHKDIKTTLGYIESDPEIIRDCINDL